MKYCGIWFVIFLLAGCYENTPPVPIPPAPANLTVTAVSETEVLLTWTDNSSYEIRFTIERKSGSEAFSKLADTGTDITSYRDKGVSSATSYTYRVFAINANGETSSPSNEVTVMTP